MTTKTSPWSATFVPALEYGDDVGAWVVYNYVGGEDVPTLFSGTFAEGEAFIEGLAFAKRHGWAK